LNGSVLIASPEATTTSAPASTCCMRVLVSLAVSDSNVSEYHAAQLVFQTSSRRVCVLLHDGENV
jgi:hypothetical protein